MILAKLVLDNAGLLRSCAVSGHAGAGKPGRDIVCAAVSVLARTVVRVLSERKDVSIRGSIPNHGDFWFETDCTAGGGEFLAAAGAFLVEGLTSVAEEFPEFCKVTIERRK